MDDAEFDSDSERQWVVGNRAAWAAMLAVCLRHLGIDDPEGGKVRWVVEREEAVAKLRELCEDYGDQDWPVDLHLADVIEKHIDWDRFEDEDDE